MGILNLTPDSFSDGCAYDTLDKSIARVEQMLTEGAAIIDIGGYSSRPGATDIPLEVELRRVEGTIAEILKRFPEAIVSIDTFRSEVAKPMLEMGVHLVNDISAGLLDPRMLETVGSFDAPYVMMHMKGSPQTMQLSPSYIDPVGEICDYFVERIRAARAAKIQDILIDPGFGFGKTMSHNWELFRKLGELKVFGLPILIGISRKSMIYKLFDSRPDDVLALTTALHLKALESGARALRVHDVRAAVHAIQLHNYLAHGVI